MESTKEIKNNSSGFIPDNWKEVTLGDHASVLRGGSPRPIESYLTKDPDGINWIKIGDVGVGAKYINQTEERIIPEGVSRSRKVFKGDFLLSNSMSFGRPYILNVDGCIHDGWLVIQEYYDSFTTDYLYYALSSQYVLEQYCSMAAGSSVLNLNKDIVKKVRILVPPKEEQKKIANALSSIDALIADLNLAIQKKRQIKEGLMQTFFTGRKCLSGSVEWKESTLGYLADICKGVQFDSDLFTEGGKYPMLNGGITPSGYSEYYNTEAETITISEGGNSCGYVNYMTEKFWCGGHCYSLKVHSSVDKLFLYQLLKFNEKAIMALRVGSGLPNVQGKVLSKFPLKYPASIKEQRAISEILNKADQEIMALESQRDKYSLIKQGMMQELLTGKTRL